jgi:hypothetical protein
MITDRSLMAPETIQKLGPLVAKYI